MAHLAPGCLFRGRYCLERRKWKGTTTIFVHCETADLLRRKALLKMFASLPDMEREIKVQLKFTPLFPELLEYSDEMMEGQGEFLEDPIPSYMVSERPAFTLQDWLECPSKAWELGDMIMTLSFIVDVLLALHSANLVLGDLSPASVAWCSKREGRPAGWKLLSASQCVQRGSRMRLIAFLRFAAPEILAAETTEEAQGPVMMSPALDMWALGCITYSIFAGKDLLGKEYSDSTVREMLTGQKDLPFEGQGASDFLAVTGLEGVPQWAQNLLRHLLRRNPLLRMTSQDIVQPAFSPAGHGQIQPSANLPLDITTSSITLPSINLSSISQHLEYSERFCQAVATLQSQGSTFGSDSSLSLGLG